MARRAFALLVLALCIVDYASAQQEVPRFEIGAQATVLGVLGQTSSCAACSVAQLSGGPAATFNISRHVALDGAFTFRPGPAGNPAFQVGGNLSQMLIGVKATTRGSRFSLFGTVRPGYVRWSHGQVTGIRMPTPNGPLVYSYGARTNFVVDLGFGLQYALNRRVGVRAEIGDTIIWWHRYGTNPLDSSLFSSSPVSNNLRITTGVFYAFGSRDSVQMHTPADSTHRFFDTLNLGLFSAGLLAQVADSITTQRRLAHCPYKLRDACAELLEGNPMARPFVIHGWSGQIVADVIGDSAWLSVALAFHRLGHHRIERFITVPVTVLGATFAYRSLQGRYR